MHKFGTMLDESMTRQLRAGRAVMGVVATTCLADRLARAAEIPSEVGEEITSPPISFPSTDADRASVRRPALPVGARRSRSDRLFRSQQPLPLSVIFGTANSVDDEPEEICQRCFRERWQCQCFGGEGVFLAPQ